MLTGIFASVRVETWQIGTVMTVADPGANFPVPPAWPGDIHAGHTISCAVRVHKPCICGYQQWLDAQAPRSVPLPADPEPVLMEPTGRVAVMILDGQLLLNHTLGLPPDIHLIEASVVENYPGNPTLQLTLEAFADDAFPGERIVPRYHKEWNVEKRLHVTRFDGFESVD